MCFTVQFFVLYILMLRCLNSAFSFKCIILICAIVPVISHDIIIIIIRSTLKMLSFMLVLAGLVPSLCCSIAKKLVDQQRLAELATVVKKPGSELSLISLQFEFKVELK